MTDKKTEKKEEVTKKDSKKKTTKKVEKKESKPQKEKVTEDKKTLLQLIKESEYRNSYIIGALGSVNLLDELKEEKHNLNNGLFIEPKLTVSEFNNIISNFLNRRI